MDVDAALLRWAAAAPGRLAVRTYAWSRPTLSLGRVEPWPDGWNTSALARDGVDVARRPTGGDGVLHDEEATFAIAASVPGPWAAAPRAFADRVADAVAAAYRTFDLAAERVRAEERGPAFPAGATPCFARSSPGEVRSGAFKLAGIASKFTRGGALSHASLPLTARGRDVALYRADAEVSAALLEGHARSAGELLGTGVAAESLAARVVASLADSFGVMLRPASFQELGVIDPSRPGAERDLPWRIEVRNVAKMFVLDSDGRVLLFQHVDPRGRVFWALPGGGLERGESAEAAARREGREELGVEAESLRHLGSGRRVFTFGNKDVIQHEEYFHMTAPRGAQVSATSTARAAESILQEGWWSADDVEAAAEPVYPEDLVTRLRALAATL